jgi:pimeloyl-ACP methyl ester carboxylesterase
MADYEIVGEMTLEALPTIPHPKLLIYDGGSLYMHSYEALAELLANCETILVPPSSMGHFALLEQADLIVERLERFLPDDESVAALSQEMPQ